MNPPHLRALLPILVAVTWAFSGLGASSAHASELYVLTSDSAIELSGRSAAPLEGTIHLVLGGICIGLPGGPITCLPPPMRYAVVDLDLAGDGVELTLKDLPVIPVSNVFIGDIFVEDGELSLAAIILEREILAEGVRAPGEGFVEFRELRLAPAFDITGSGYGSASFDDPGDQYPSAMRLNYVLQDYTATFIHDTGADDGLIFGPHIERGSTTTEMLGVVTIHMDHIPDSPLLLPTIDIKPNSDSNPINPYSRAVIPVAILGSDTFDVLDVDLTTLAFGPDGAAPAFDLTNPWVLLFSRWDVNRDGNFDLIPRFRTQETGIAFGDTEACVTGELLDGTPFEGCDEILVVGGGCGLGFELALLLPGLMWLRKRRRSN